MNPKTLLKTVGVLLFGHAWAQYIEMIPGTYTDQETGIDFVTWSPQTGEGGVGGYTFGIALPEDALKTDSKEYIGFLQCSKTSPDEAGWCGVAHAGHMVDDLLLVAWPHEGQVLTSFRYASGYYMPALYSGNSTVTQIRSAVNDTNYELVFRCQDCLWWSEEGYEPGSLSTSNPDQYATLGYAQSKAAPQPAGCPGRIGFTFHDDGFAQYFAEYAGAVSPKYKEWAALATKTVTGTCS
ncbi:hypothetical protein RB594_008492 [Gaeumannomyces avenae]